MAVANNSTSEFDCSPRLHDSYFEPFLGILINGPEIIEWPGDVSRDEYLVGPFGQTSGPFRLMISGVVQARYQTMDLNGDFSEQVLVVAVDQETARTYTGKIHRPDSLPEPDPQQSDDLFPEPAEMSDIEMNKAVSNHFNIDLVENLRIPIANATYIVYATLGDYKSNVLIIEARVE